MPEVGVPEGFDRHFRKSGLTDPWEPLYSRKLEDRIQLGLIAAEQHCNSRAIVHGGLIASLADNAMGLSCASAMVGLGRDPSAGLVTVALNTEYVGSATEGQWLEFDPEIVKIGGSLCFGRAIVRCNNEPVAMTSATFKIL